MHKLRRFKSGFNVYESLLWDYSNTREKVFRPKQLNLNKTDNERQHKQVK